MKRSMKLLPQISLSILVALSLKPRHGYEIMKQVNSDSLGKINLGPGSLYTTIDQLIKEELIEEVKEVIDERRRYYKLTHKGWERLDAEIEYFKQILKLTKERVEENYGQI